MSDQSTQAFIDSLRKDWQNLKQALSTCDKIRVEFFLEALKSTDQLLRSCVTADSVSKEYIPLIADIYAFVDADGCSDDIPTQAAKILTERLLYQYVVCTYADEKAADRVAIYLLQKKRQLLVDLSDLACAFSAIVEALQW